jgi:phthiodiolone/phenolphthiodiolone dimycocerosates ketoreductase
MLQLAGRFCDGWYPADIVDPADYARRLEVVRRSASEAGRDPMSIVPSGEFVVFVAPSDEEAEARLASPEAQLNGLLLPETAWSEHGLRHPLGDGFRGFVDYQPRSSNQVAAKHVSPELLADNVLWGAPDTIARRVSALCDAGLTHVNLAFGPITERIVEEGLVSSVIKSIRSAARMRA